MSILQYSILQHLVISDMFVGHLGERELASRAIALTFASMTGTTTLMGMASAVLETLCGQAYGAKQYHASAGNLLAKSVVCVVPVGDRVQPFPSQEVRRVNIR